MSWWIHCGTTQTYLSLTQYLSLSDTVVKKEEWPEKNVDDFLEINRKM